MLHEESRPSIAPSESLSSPSTQLVTNGCSVRSGSGLSSLPSRNERAEAARDASRTSHEASHALNPAQFLCREAA